MTRAGGIGDSVGRLEHPGPWQGQRAGTSVDDVTPASVICTRPGCWFIAAESDF